MELHLKTAPTALPVSLQEAKDHLYLKADDQNAEVEQKLAAAVDYCQSRIPGGRQLMSATWEQLEPEFPGNDGRIELATPPLQSVTSVKYYDTDGTLQTLSSTGYQVMNSSTGGVVQQPGWVEPAYGESWPSTRDRPDAVQVRYVAGYTSAANVPGTIKEAVKLKLEHLWDPARVKTEDMDLAIDSLLNVNAWGRYA